MTGQECAAMCNLINHNTHTHIIHTPKHGVSQSKADKITRLVLLIRLQLFRGTKDDAVKHRVPSKCIYVRSSLIIYVTETKSEVVESYYSDTLNTL